MRPWSVSDTGGSPVLLVLGFSILYLCIGKGHQILSFIKPHCHPDAGQDLWIATRTYTRITKAP